MPRNLPGRSITMIMLCGVVGIGIAGCEDEAAQKRAEAQLAIEAASEDLQTALSATPLPGDEDVDAVRSDLERVIRDLGSVRDGAAGQEVAANLLLAAAHRGLAELSLADAEAIESEHRNQRAIVHSHFDAAVRLGALADSREHLDAGEVRAMLSRERSQQQRNLSRHSDQLAEVAGPIANLERENQQDGQAAARLQNEANDLRRRAAQFGHADGFSTYQEAIRLERDADNFELQMARRDNELEYTYRPVYTLAEKRAGAAQSILEEIAESERAIDEVIDVRRAQAGETRDLLDEFATAVRGTVTELDAQSEGELAEFYADTLEQLDKTRQFAQRALSRSDRDAKNTARLTIARAWETEGRANAARARGLGGHHAVLSRIVDAGDTLGNSGTYRSMLSRTSEGHDDAVDLAVTAFEGALESLSSVNSRGAEAHLTDLQASLQTNIALLTGAPVPAASQAASSPESSGGRMPAGMSSSSASGGMPTPEALIELLQGLETGEDAVLAQIISAIHTPTESSRTIVDLIRQTSGASAELQRAVIEQFGADAAEAASSNSGATISFAFPELTITERDDDQVRATYTEAMQTKSLTFVRVDGAWFVDGDTIAPEMEPMLPQMKMMGPVIAETTRDMAARVRAGEFASMADVEQAMVQAIMAAMSGGAAMDMGGPGGGLRSDGP